MPRPSSDSCCNLTPSSKSSIFISSPSRPECISGVRRVMSETASSIVDNRPWYQPLSRYQWFVFIVCCLAWDMDCMDQQLFTLARRPAMEELVPPVLIGDPRLGDLKTDMDKKAKDSGNPLPSAENVVKAQHDADIGEAA